jgi:prepilin peptidase CpaA
MGILIGVFIVAVFMDLKYYRIPNKLIIFGIVSGLIYSVYNYSYHSLFQSLLCMAVIFVAFFPFYILGGLGAGDIKLFLMTGCFIRNGSLLNFILVTMIIGAVISVVKMIAFKESRQRLVYLGRYVRRAALNGTVERYEIDRTNRKAVIRMAIPAFVSLILMCVGVYI